MADYLKYRNLVSLYRGVRECTWKWVERSIPILSDDHLWVNARWLPDAWECDHACVQQFLGQDGIPNSFEIDRLNVQLPGCKNRFGMMGAQWIGQDFAVS
jgi:hypothetical protein